ncbi:MAG: enoyl-CoA hydratase/isomerase family protein [Actinomycetota bacterium]
MAEHEDSGVVTTDDHGGTVRHLTVPGGPLAEATARRLVTIVDHLAEDRAVRVVTLSSRRVPFCPGPAPGFEPLSIDPDPAAAVARLRVPVVVAVEGACHSVGLELVLAADVRLCSTDATFALPDVADGRLPCWGGTQRLARAVRPAEATSMLLLGTELDAERATALGLVHQVVDDPSAALTATAQTLATRGPLALEMAKEAVHRGAELPLRDGLRLEGDLNHQLAATEDRAEGLQAFFDKRPPDFAGR